MAAPIGRHEKRLGKLVLQQSSFVNPKSRHTLSVESHWFNYSVGLVFPNSQKVPDGIHDLCLGENSYLVPDLPVVALVDPDLIGAFLKRGKLHVLSHGTKIDANDCVALLPTENDDVEALNLIALFSKGRIKVFGHLRGITPFCHLTLHVSKTTFVQLGLEGKPSKFNKHGTEKYVIDIDLTAEHFVPGKKFYDRVEFCLKDKLKMDFLITWTPNDDELCSSSVEKYFKVKGFQCLPLPVKSNTYRYKDAEVPDLVQSKCSVASHDFHINLFDWLGGVANNIVLSNKMDDYLSTYQYPGEREITDCIYQQYTGFFSSHTVLQLLDKVREIVTNSQAGWVSLTVHGFVDSPVTCGHSEHGYLKSGDNLYTYVVFPDDTYWLYTATSTLDFIT